MCAFLGHDGVAMDTFVCHRLNSWTAVVKAMLGNWGRYCQLGRGLVGLVGEERIFHSCSIWLPIWKGHRCEKPLLTPMDRPSSLFVLSNRGLYQCNVLDSYSDCLGQGYQFSSLFCSHLNLGTVNWEGGKALTHHLLPYLVTVWMRNMQGQEKKLASDCAASPG